jgi:hypothetical protein
MLLPLRSYEPVPAKQLIWLALCVTINAVQVFVSWNKIRLMNVEGLALVGHVGQKDRLEAR